MLLGATGRPLTPRVRPVVEHARHPMTDLDGLESAAEGLVERALDQPLEPALEPLESHGRIVVSADHRPLDAWGTLVRCATPGEWRNWQTRRLQVPVSERMWGFKSPLAHRSPARTLSREAPAAIRSPPHARPPSGRRSRSRRPATTPSRARRRRAQRRADRARRPGLRAARVLRLGHRHAGTSTAWPPTACATTTSTSPASARPPAPA